MKNTKIQWCHSTVNPVMGCDGCELWKPAAAIAAIMLAMLLLLTKKPKVIVQPAIKRAVGDRETSGLYRDREQVAEDLAVGLSLTREQQKQVVDVIRKECKCYAGFLGTVRAGHAGYADQFEMPKVYPGRVANAAKWNLPDETEIPDKPWLRGLPRLIFVSDMGDALSASVRFDYLRGEIIENVVSEDGRRHLWLWLTKRPGRMAEFGEWLQNQGISWPHHLVPMTTVIMQRYEKTISPDPAVKHPNYPAVFSIYATTEKDEGERFADLVAFLKQAGVIEDYSQVALLLHSVRQEHSGHFLAALEAKGTPAFCPRARAYFDNDEVRMMVACLALIFGYHGVAHGLACGSVAVRGESKRQHWSARA